MFYLGMDVAKAKLDCCLLLDEASSKRKTKVVNNTQSGIVDLLAWVAKQNVSPEELHIVMEATGVYHEQAAMALADAGVRVSIVNPAQVKDFGRGLAVRTKTDGVDSFVLARYGALLKPAAWTPPAPEARMLQALLARREAVAQDLQRERNRQEKANGTDTPERIRQSLADSIEFLVKQLARLQQEIDEHIGRYPGLKDDLDLLQSIPAVGPQVSSNILSVMHSHDFGGPCIIKKLSRTTGGLFGVGASGAAVGQLGARACQALQGRACQNTRRAVYGRHRGDALQPARQSRLWPLACPRQIQDVCPRCCNAQAGTPVLRCNQNTQTLPVRLCKNRLTGKTVSTTDS